MSITTHPAARPATIEEAVDLYEARLYQFEHVFHRCQRNARTRHAEVPHVPTRAEAEIGRSWNAPMAAARRLLLLAEQYLAAFGAHADYQTSPGAAARVIASSGRCLRVVREGDAS